MSNFRRRLIMSIKKKENFDDFKKLEYIETTGTQYIDTGYFPNPTTTKIETRFSLTNNTVIIQRIFGARDNPKSVSPGSCNIFFNVNQDKIRLDWTGKLLTKYVNLNEEITLICINNKATVIQNGVSTEQIGSEKLTTKLPYSMYIGTFNNAGTVDGIGAYAKWENFKIYDENNNLVMRMIPCYRKSDGEIGMYDLVNNKFYTNRGTGTFIKGPDVLFDYEEFYNNYVTIPNSDVGRYAIKLEPNTSYIVRTNLQFIPYGQSNPSSKVFVISGSNTIWTPSTSLNGVLPDKPRTITTNSQGYMCIGIYVTGAYVVNKSEFEDDTAWVKIEKAEN